MIWNETKECMSRDEMTNLQSARLAKLVDKVYHNVEYYRKKMQAVGLEPGDIKGIEDLDKLPFTTKDDLRDTYHGKGYCGGLYSQGHRCLERMCGKVYHHGGPGPG